MNDRGERIMQDKVLVVVVEILQLIFYKVVGMQVVQYVYGGLMVIVFLEFYLVYCLVQEVYVYIYILISMKAGGVLTVRFFFMV